MSYCTNCNRKGYNYDAHQDMCHNCPYHPATAYRHKERSSTSTVIIFFIVSFIVFIAFCSAKPIIENVQESKREVTTVYSQDSNTESDTESEVSTYYGEYSDYIN